MAGSSEEVEELARLKEVVSSLYGLITVPHGYSERQREEIIKRAGEVLRGQPHTTDR
jgi:hypothetical protein